MYKEFSIVVQQLIQCCTLYRNECIEYLAPEYLAAYYRELTKLLEYLAANYKWLNKLLEMSII